MLINACVSSNVDAINSNTPPVRRRPVRTDEATMDVIKTMINHLAAGDWRIRYDAINTFLEMCVDRPETISMNIVKVRGCQSQVHAGWYR